MIQNKTVKSFLSVIMISLIGCKTETEPKKFFDWVKPAKGLQMIGEGTLSRENADLYNFAFTENGDTIFFHTTNKGDGNSGVAMSVRTASGWSQPVNAPFETDGFNEGHVSMSPNGKHIIFASDRTANLKGQPKPADDFFMVSQSSGWTEATQLTFTPKMSEKRGTLANDSTFYYWAYQRGSGMYFFKGRLNKENKIIKREHAEDLFFNDYKGENNPYVEPNNSFMLIAVYGKEDGYGKEDIYISKRKNNTWTRPENLGPVINTEGNDTSPFVSPDGQYLFFVSDRLTSENDTLDNRNLYAIKTSLLKSFDN